MPRLKPWYKIVTPREDLREGKPLDASEFAVHLDQVRDGRANEDYQNPVRFFERTFLTKSLRQMAGEVVRRPMVCSPQGRMRASLSYPSRPEAKLVLQR